MKPIDFSYFIERYIAGEMSQEEKTWFQKELDGNRELQNEVNLRKRADVVLKEKDILSLRNKLSEIEKLRAAPVPVKNTKRPVYFKYAAALAVLLLLGSIVLFPGKKLTNAEIMKRYYTTYEPTAGQRSMQTNADEDFTQALEFFKTHDYKNAAVYFSKVVESEPKDMYATLLKGISNFEERQYPDAKQSFGKVIDDNKNLYIDQAQWYLALCYLNTGEKVKAVQLLGVIKDEGGFYAKKAFKIIKQIN